MSWGPCISSNDYLVATEWGDWFVVIDSWSLFMGNLGSLLITLKFGFIVNRTRDQNIFKH